MKYIYHHLGLGDHIICNGLVRYYQKIYEKITVFCKPHNFLNVKYMYRDNKNIEVLPIGEDYDVENYIINNNLTENIIKVGFEYLRGGKTFDESFYIGKEIPFSVRYGNFYLERDYEIEKKIMNDLNPKNENYIFTHNVDMSRIRKDLKIIENPINYNIFNLITLIENAEEVHLMESSIKCLVNSYKMDKPKFFYHNYVRNYDSYINSMGLNKFETIY
jgi:hypothetical protein